MRVWTAEIRFPTDAPRALVDITERVRREIAESGVQVGTCSLYAQGATAALMIQENDDPNLALDVLECLDGLVPAGRWRHDRVDDNGAAHIQAGLVGPSETLPIRRGRPGLSTWQNVFFCDFDGPRRERVVLCTIIGK